MKAITLSLMLALVFVSCSKNDKRPPKIYPTVEPEFSIVTKYLDSQHLKWHQSGYCMVGVDDDNTPWTTWVSYNPSQRILVVISLMGDCHSEFDSVLFNSVRNRHLDATLISDGKQVWLRTTRSGKLTLEMFDVAFTAHSQASNEYYFKLFPWK